MRGLVKLGVSIEVETENERTDNNKGKDANAKRTQKAEE